MSPQHARLFSRRRFMSGMTLMGAAGLLGWCPESTATEPPPEVQKIRLVHTPAICLSPTYLAEELLRLEGFSEIEYVDVPIPKSLNVVEEGWADMTMGARRTSLPPWMRTGACSRWRASMPGATSCS